MRIAVIGATGNVGTSVVRALGADDSVEQIIGIARRRPELEAPKTRWVGADISRDDLVPAISGCDAVIHLAWLIQPSRDEGTTRATNVEGSARVFEAVTRAEVPVLVYASSVGAYSPGPKHEPIDESWPTDGISTSFYSRHKAEVERLLDRFEEEHADVRVVRLRPGLIFKREAASGIRRLFAGPLLPGFLVRPHLLPLLPLPDRLVFQAVHSYDVGEAYRLAATGQARGAFNIAADPVLDPSVLARHFGARRVSLPGGVLRRAADVTWRLRLQPSPAGWVDMALQCPVMSTDRARETLGWTPRRTSLEALDDLLAGLRHGDGVPTPPLDPDTGGPMRSREVLTGVGGTSR